MENEKKSKLIKFFAISAILILLCTGATALTAYNIKIDKNDFEKDFDPNDEPLDESEEEESEEDEGEKKEAEEEEDIKEWLRKNLVHDIWVSNNTAYKHNLKTEWRVLKENICVTYIDCHSSKKSYKLFIDGEFHSSSFACIGGGTTFIGEDPDDKDKIVCNGGFIGVIGHRFKPLDTELYENGPHVLKIIDEKGDVVANIEINFQN